MSVFRSSFARRPRAAEEAVLRGARQPRLARRRPPGPSECRAPPSRQKPGRTILFHTIAVAVCERCCSLEPDDLHSLADHTGDGPFSGGHPSRPVSIFPLIPPVPELDGSADHDLYLGQIIERLLYPEVER